MKIQLVNPPVYVSPSALTALRPAPPLGLAYVAAALREAGHAVSVLDAVALAPTRTTPEGPVHRLGLGDAEILERIEPDADAVAVGNMWTFAWPAVRTMIHAIRARFPRKLIVCGGEHFTGLPEHSMRQAPIDYVVMGEGEDVATRLFAALEAGTGFDPATVPGVCWRRGDDVVRNPRAERLRDVDSLPWPAWDLFRLDVYDAHDLVAGIRFGRTVPILATRGCPYRCTYCSSPQMWTTRWYARDPAKVADEIEYWARSHGATNFPLQDLTAIIRRDWIVAFCRELIRRDLGITWQMPSGTRCEVVDEEVAGLLARSGGRSLSFAPESGSERTRELIRKRMTTEHLMRAVRAATGAGLNLSVLLVIGFPHDTAEDLRATARLCRRLARLGVDDVACAYFFPIPATELWDELLARGRVAMDDASLMLPVFVHDRHLAPARSFCDHLTARQLTWFKYRIVAGFYLASVLARPARPFRHLRNLLAGREASKMDTFLKESARKIGRGGGLGRRRADPQAAGHTPWGRFSVDDSDAGRLRPRGPT